MTRTEQTRCCGQTFTIDFFKFICKTNLYLCKIWNNAEIIVKILENIDSEINFVGSDEIISKQILSQPIYLPHQQK